MHSFGAMLLGIAMGIALSSCAVGPDYSRPPVETPTEWKEASGWKSAQPQDELPRGEWWKVYADPDLDVLMAQIDISNQTVQQAAAQYRAARALVQDARAAYFPSVGLSASGARAESRSSITTVAIPNTATGAPIGTTPTSPAAPTTPTTPTTFTVTNALGAATSNAFSVGLDASWEPDIWGKLRRASENARANAAASAADLAAARLSIQAELAQDYFQMRITDQEKRLYDDNVAGQQRSLQITQNQYKVGLASQADIAEALSLLRATQASAIDLGIARAQLEHAIAVLVGKPAANFSLAPAPLQVRIPSIPLQLPSELLERRPDIAASERLVAAANANIGIAKAAFFPSLTLSGTAGFANNSLSDLFSIANRFWSLGPSVTLTLLDFGARRALTDQAIANYDSSVAVYRQTVLAAFQDTEDNLVSLRVLADEITVQDEATKAADDYERIALNQYRTGIVSYLNVVVAQTTALTNERASLTVRGRQLASSVALIKSLGGSWAG